jgi:osmoprotectant transport system ATP-binding protein
MIELRSVTKRYGDAAAPAVDDLSMDIGSGELCVIVGPSGCGKTTTLKMINRLIEPTSGEILIDGEDVLASNPVELRRRIGYVMQQGGLFPHLRVADNVATVPRLLGWPKEKIAARVEELLELVGLPAATYLRRYPYELSGGERQRVGVARALGGDPPVLLMDEPFGAVDPIARKRLQAEFYELQRRLEKTVVFVTHDIEEALFLGKRIAIMQRGAVLEQYDTPQAILAKPATPFVTQFVGVDRDLQRLAVTDLSREDLDAAPVISAAASTSDAAELLIRLGVARLVVLDAAQQPVGVLGQAELSRLAANAGEAAIALGATLPLGSSLKAALAALLQSEEDLLAITDGSRYVGLLTMEGLHGAMRRSAGSPPAAD